METPSSPILESQLTDITGLRQCGIFPAGKEPSIRTLRAWTKLRRIPHHKVGHFVYYDPAEVANHIRHRLKIPARGYPFVKTDSRSDLPTTRRPIVGPSIPYPALGTCCAGVLFLWIKSPTFFPSAVQRYMYRACPCASGEMKVDGSRRYEVRYSSGRFSSPFVEEEIYFPRFSSRFDSVAVPDANWG